MQTISYTEARNSLKSVLDGVAENAEPTIIKRRKNNDAVVMSLSHYNGLMETLHLLRYKKNAEHLARSIEQFRASETIEKPIIDE